MTRTLTPVAEALERVCRGLTPLPAEQVSLREGLGRVLAVDLTARRSQPPVAVSAMDGYAIRAVDVAAPPATLTCIGVSAAGAGFAGEVAAGQAVRIYTGAPIPTGADAVVVQEDAEAEGDRVLLRAGAKAGRFVRPAGLDFAEGDVLLRAGRALTARDLGLAASMNLPWLAVRRRPRVAFLATGDELFMPGETGHPEGIPSSNSVAMAACVEAWGGLATDLGIARDDEGALSALLAGARGADLLVTMGGASVGDRDLVRKVLGERGFALDFFRVAMRPGMPLVHGHLDGTPVIGLPGNPVSSGVTGLLFVRAAMRTLLALPASEPLPTAVLGAAVPANDHRQDYLRAALRVNADGSRVATPFPTQDSSMLASLARADCLVVRPPHAPAAAAGEMVEVVLFPPAA